MQKQAPSPHQADTHQAKPQAKYCMYYTVYALQNTIVSIVSEIRIQ